jgi:hypothetical protein
VTQTNLQLAAFIVSNALRTAILLSVMQAPEHLTNPDFKRELVPLEGSAALADGVRPGDGKAVSRDAYREFGLGDAGTVSACGASDDPSSVSCAATETNAPLVGRDDLPARREYTSRWKCAYRCAPPRSRSPGAPQVQMEAVSFCCKRCGL